MGAETIAGHAAAAQAAGFALNPRETRSERLQALVDGRWMELIAGADGRLTVASLISVNAPVKPLAMAQFNNYNLLHGGYGLMSPVDTGAVYLFKRWPPEALPPEAAAERFRTVKVRADQGVAWYRAAEDATLSPAPAA